jgi:hypothetical protein
MTRKKNTMKFALQMRVVLVWLVLIFAIFSLWNIYNPVVVENVREEWSISRVLAAAENNSIISGIVRSVPANGPEWYRLFGEAKLDKPRKLPDGKTQTSVFFRGSWKIDR